MSFALLFEQLLNGLQFGVTLFLMAAGLTLVFGIMNFVNLAHGSLYMVGAYLALAAAQWTGSYLLGVLLGLAGTLVVGMLVEVIALRTLYDARPPRPGARHLRPDPVLQRAGRHPLGPRRAVRLGAAVPLRPHRALHRLELSAVPRGDHRGRLRRRASSSGTSSRAPASAC